MIVCVPRVLQEYERTKADGVDIFYERDSAVEYPFRCCYPIDVKCAETYEESEESPILN